MAVQIELKLQFVPADCQIPQFVSNFIVAVTGLGKKGKTGPQILRACVAFIQLQGKFFI